MLGRTDAAFGLRYRLLVWVVRLRGCILIPLQSACRWYDLSLLWSQGWDLLWNWFYRILVSKSTSPSCQRLFTLRINDPLLWILLNITGWKVSCMHEWCYLRGYHRGLLLWSWNDLWSFNEDPSIFISCSWVCECLSVTVTTLAFKVWVLERF